MHNSNCSRCWCSPDNSYISDVASATKGTTVKVIADGGIRFSGDISKALVSRSSFSNAR